MRAAIVAVFQDDVVSAARIAPRIGISRQMFMLRIKAMSDKGFLYPHPYHKRFFPMLTEAGVEAFFNKAQELNDGLEEIKASDLGQLTDT